MPNRLAVPDATGGVGGHRFAQAYPAHIAHIAPIAHIAHIQLPGPYLWRFRMLPEAPACHGDVRFPGALDQAQALVPGCKTVLHATRPHGFGHDSNGWRRRSSKASPRPG